MINVSLLRHWQSFQILDRRIIFEILMTDLVKATSNTLISRKWVQKVVFIKEPSRKSETCYHFLIFHNFFAEQNKKHEPKMNNNKRLDEKNSQRDKSGNDKNMPLHSSPSKYDSPSKKAHDSPQHKSKSSKMWLEFFDVNRMNWCAFSKRSTLQRCFVFFFIVKNWSEYRICWLKS